MDHKHLICRELNIMPITKRVVAESLPEYRFTIRNVDGTSHGVYTKRVEAKNADQAWTTLVKELKSSGLLKHVISITKG